MKLTPEQQHRNEVIVKARREGTASLGQLAAQFGISRERVRQIQVKGGVSNREAAEAYARRKSDNAFDQANEHASAILMRYIGGEDVPAMAHSLGLPVKAVQEVLDEQVTDEVVAARSNTRMAQRYPHRDAGPRDQAQAREDRYWTEDRCWEALVYYAYHNNGALPSSTQYQKISSGIEWLPSFATVRNRLGRWSSVRAEVHRRLSKYQPAGGS